MIQVACIDFDLLKSRYYIHTRPIEGTVLSSAVSHLSDEAKVASFLRQYGQYVGAQDMQAAGVYFANWYGIACAALLFSASTYDQAPDFSPDNLIVHVFEQSGRCRIGFQLRDGSRISEAGGDRRVWRNKLYRSFYTEHVFPLMRRIADASNVRITELWAQISLRAHYANDYALEIAQSQDRRRIVQDDFAFIKQEIEAVHLGCKRNPFDVSYKYTGSPYEAGKPARVKEACCLAYRTEAGQGYCYTCPRLNERAREERKHELSQEASAK